MIALAVAATLLALPAASPPASSSRAAPGPFAPPAGACAPEPAAPLPALAACAPDAAPDPGLRARIDALLGAIDAPVGAEAWRSLPAGADGLLAELAASPRALPSRRARALQALALRGGPRALEVHRSLAADASAPPGVRVSAVRGLGRLLPPAEAARAVAPLGNGDAPPSVRRAVAEVVERGAPER